MMEETTTTPSTQENQNGIVDTRTFDEKFKDFTGKAMSLMPLFCAIGIAIWWILYGTVKVEKLQIGIVERIALTICTIFIAITYCQLISEGGFQAAKNTKEHKALTTRWNVALKGGNACKREIIEYAKDIARQNQKDIRMENLERNGINYYEIFDDDGKVVKLDYYLNKYHKRTNPTGYNRKQIRVIDKCVNLNVQIPEMFGNISSKWFGLKKRRTQKEYDSKSSIKRGVIRAVISFLSVGLAFTFVGISAGAMVFAFFQLVLWTSSGILQRVKNYNFIVKEIRPQILENCLIIEGYLELSQDKKDVYVRKVIENDEKSKPVKQIEMKGVNNQ